MKEDLLAADCEISQRLGVTWNAFFARFGRLTEVQRQAIPVILSGANALVCAATASGKTEAVCAPILERLVSRPGPWTVLYIVPTRALVNDLFERLIPPCHSLGLEIVHKTGDHPYLPKRPPHLLLTTPESFDSMLCRGKSEELGHILASTVAVVLDEIHLLAGSPRGEQLRWLLERLRRLKSYAKEQGWCSVDEFRRYALSATVADPDQVAQDYLGPGARVVKVDGGREIEVVCPPEVGMTVETALPAYLAGLTEREKILVFCNARARVDHLATELRPALGQLGYTVCAHHGSLSKTVRENTEETAKKDRAVILFATSTLEIGIDIGDVDLVVLDGPAPDVSAMLQRMGRGNRRTQKTRLMCCAGNVRECLLHEAMLAAARGAFIGCPLSGPNYAVARQQVASYIFQSARRHRAESTLLELLGECWRGPTAPKALLGHFAEQGEIHREDLSFRMSEEWVDLASRGGIHSNIEGALGYSVLDDKTGATIATGVVLKDGGRNVRLAGQWFEVRSTADRQVFVRALSRQKGLEANWGYVTSKWAPGRNQTECVRWFLGIEENIWPVLSSVSGSAALHFGGGPRAAVLRLMGSAARQPVRCNEWLLESQLCEKPRWLDDVDADAVRREVEKQLDRVESWLARPAANKRMPLECRLHEALAWLDLEAELAAIRESVWQATSGELEGILRGLAGDLNTGRK